MTRRRKLLFTLVVQVVLLGLAEAGVRIHTLVSGGVPPTADRSLEREWMWARRHLEAGSAVLPGEHVFDPQLGWRNAPDLDTALVRTNAAGMRNTNDFEPGRGSRPRIAFLGDSYTFGPFVTNEASFVGRVGAALPDHDVLNFGVNGYGTDQAQLTYELHARTYRPDVVVMGYFVRDYRS